MVLLPVDQQSVPYHFTTDGESVHQVNHGHRPARFYISLIIIIKILIKCKIVSVETILSMHAHTQHTDFKKLNLHNLKQAASRDFRVMSISTPKPEHCSSVFKKLTLL